MARHVGRLKLRSKPAQLYVRLSIIPLSQQANHVSSGIIRHLIVAFVCLHLYLTGYQSAQIVRRPLHYASESRKFLHHSAQPQWRSVYIVIYRQTVSLYHNSSVWLDTYINTSTHSCTYVCMSRYESICICVSVCVHVYIYIYIYKQTFHTTLSYITACEIVYATLFLSHTDTHSLSLSLFVYIYIYIYIYG